MAVFLGYDGFLVTLARELLGIGVDLVSKSRIERFLANHTQEFLNRLFTPTEQISFQQSSQPVEFFARSFAAKEAYFKARGGIALREADFRETEVLMGEGTRFQVRNSGASSLLRAEGRFFASPDGVGAKMMVWREREF